MTFNLKKKQRYVTFNLQNQTFSFVLVSHLCHSCRTRVARVACVLLVSHIRVIKYTSSTKTAFLQEQIIFD